MLEILYIFEMNYSQTQRNKQTKSMMFQSACFRNDNFGHSSKKTLNGILNSLTITESRMTEGQLDKIIQCNQNNANAKAIRCQSCAIWDDWIIYFQHSMLKIEQRMIQKQKLLQNKLKQLTNQLVMHKEMLETKQIKYENQKLKNQQLVTQINCKLKELERQNKQDDRRQQQKKGQKNVNDWNCDLSKKLCKIKNNKQCCQDIVTSFKNKQNSNQFYTDINPTQRNYNIANKKYKKLSCSIQHFPEETAIQNNQTFQQYETQQKLQQKNKQFSLQKAKINNFHSILTYQSIYNQSIDTFKNPIQQKDNRNLKSGKKKEKNQNFSGLLSFVENDSRQSLARNQRNYKQIVQEKNMKNEQNKQFKQQNQLQNQNNLIQSKYISKNNQFNKTLKNISQHNQIHRPNKKQLQLTTNHNISNTINLSHLMSQYQNENRKPNNNSQNNLISQSQKSFLFQMNTFTSKKSSQQQKKAFTSNKSSQPQKKVGTVKTIKLNLNNCQINVQKSRFNQTTDCSFLNDCKNGNYNQNKVFDNQYNQQRLGWEIAEPKIKNNKTKKQDGLQQKNKKKILEEMSKLQIENQNLKSYNRVLLQKLSNSRPKKY